MATGILRAPRAYLQVSAGNITPTEVSYEMTTYRKSDGFSARVALDSNAGMDEIYWSNLTETAVTIFATNDANNGGFVPAFVGNIDDVDIDFLTRTAMIRGRDLGAALLETNSTEPFVNQSTTQIVNQIAGRVGLTAVVSVPSNDRIGAIYKTDNTRTISQDTLFNILTRLAKRAGCIFWINGKVLNFVPPEQVTGQPFTIQYQRPTPVTIAQGNFVTLQASRSYRLSRDIKVRTKSFQLKQKKGLVSEYNMAGSVSGSIVHEYRAPNLTKQQADAFTQARLNDISSLEKKLQIGMPGDVNVTPECPVNLIGTGTEFDQEYIISRVSHSFSQNGGYRMSMSVRNKDKDRTAEQTSGASDAESDFEDDKAADNED